ncbi:hypothetical protein, partial [Streptobacillus moniliformis]|uniref:hypothetical protein n=1 Tax=Streptobacillus moniliformis TaxID=34105 RepID=UPI0018C86821
MFVLHAMILPKKNWGRLSDRQKTNYEQMKQPEADQELQGFFQAMKEKDQSIPVPEFPEIKKSKTINWWIPAGIAAS